MFKVLPVFKSVFDPIDRDHKSKDADKIITNDTQDHDTKYAQDQNLKDAQDHNDKDTQDLDAKYAQDPNPKDAQDHTEKDVKINFAVDEETKDAKFPHSEDAKNPDTKSPNQDSIQLSKQCNHSSIYDSNPACLAWCLTHVFCCCFREKTCSECGWQDNGKTSNI